MKLYLLQCGTIRTKKRLLVAGAPPDERIEVPVPFYLIEHEKGCVLFDTGQPFAAIGSLGGGDYVAVMTEADYVTNRLRDTGFKTDEVTHIVLSHLHSDHAGGLEAFPDTACYIQRKEAASPNVPGRWLLLDGEKDLFGDGRIKILPTPGHSPGHQSLLLNLERSGEILLAADSVYTDEILDNNVLPGVFHNQEETLGTLDRIRTLKQRGVRVITGHDPEAWQELRLAPFYYE